MTDDRPANPFRDLEPYTREDRASFFGRDSDLTLDLDRVLTRRTTLLFAGSGVGALMSSQSASIKTASSGVSAFW